MNSITALVKRALKNLLNLLSDQWKSLSGSNQRIILGAALFLIGAFFPYWKTLGEFGTYIQFGLIVGGLVSATIGVSKPKKKASGKKKVKNVCSKCGRKLKKTEKFCPECGKKVK